VAGKHLYSKIKNLLVIMLRSIPSPLAEHSRMMEIVPELKALQPHICRNVMEYLIGKCLGTLHLRVVREDAERFKVYNGR
jgi:hypothetical protein